MLSSIVFSPLPSFVIAPLGEEEPNPGAELPPNMEGEDAGFPPKEKGLAGDELLDAPNAKALVEAALEPPNAKGLDVAAEEGPPKEKVEGERVGPKLEGAPKPEKTEGGIEGWVETSLPKFPKAGLLLAFATPKAGVLEAPPKELTWFVLLVPNTELPKGVLEPEDAPK